jgi:hypothetical protein
VALLGQAHIFGTKLSAIVATLQAVQKSELGDALALLIKWTISTLQTIMGRGGGASFIATPRFDLRV